VLRKKEVRSLGVFLAILIKFSWWEVRLSPPVVARENETIVRGNQPGFRLKPPARLTAGVHKVEHECLFVVKVAGLTIFENLVREIEQRGNNLQVSFIAIILLAQ
jgi:hypothetical protein